MLRNIKSLLGYTLEGTDGNVGKVEDFYFGENTWIIRYLIIKTGDWLQEGNLFISPKILVKSEKNPGIFLINLSLEQIKNSLNFDLLKSVFQKQDNPSIGHYSSQIFGGKGLYSFSSDISTNDHSASGEKEWSAANDLFIRSDAHIQLRNTKKINGYHIYTHGEDFGQVIDFILDVSKWQITSLVIDAHNWFGGKRFVTAIGAIQEIQWDKSVIILNISRNGIKNCPEYDEMHFKYFQSVIH